MATPKPKCRHDCFYAVVNVTWLKIVVTKLLQCRNDVLILCFYFCGEMKKTMFLRKVILVSLFSLVSFAAMAASFKGVVIDSETNEPLIGATVIVDGSTYGTTSDIDGSFELELKEGSYVLVVSYMSYVTREVEIMVPGGVGSGIVVELEPDTQMVDAVTITARKSMEAERTLQLERISANVAIENIGAREMSLKGLSNAQESVKKLTGISIASAGQLVVRGLGDRYSITTLNGQPIASPNPDNKLIPLDIFPSSTVKNITVSKVYEVGSFADYSGAHIDIGTKDNGGGNFFSFDVNVGGQFNTVGREFYCMDNVSLFGQSKVDPVAMSSSLPDFRNYVKSKDIFDTGFSVSRSRALPSFGGNLAWGHDFRVGSQKLSVLLSGGMSTDQQTINDGETRLLEATGTVTDEYGYDSYATELKIAALASVGLTLRESDLINYTFFYARNAEDTYTRKEGFDQEGHNLVGSNDVVHVYKLMTNQLNGVHEFGDAWKLHWSGSYTSSSADEPDRRQVMFIKENDGSLGLFKLNQQETMRYFGTLDENEWNGQASAEYTFAGHELIFGVAYKDKEREYAGTRFYYNLSGISPDVDDIYDTDGYLNYDNVADGSIVINRQRQPRDSYDAGNRILAGYAAIDLNFGEAWLVNAGLRYEVSRQWVNYVNDQSIAERRDLNKNDLFPALNIRYAFGPDSHHQLRLAGSRTVTRPSFIEMAPFLYQESYGSVQLRGNENLQNGYNYNVDLRYEFLNDRGDMVSVTAYYKYLDKPIERVQMLSGGGTVHTFRNANHGMAAGLEIELRKAITKNLRVAVNGSYMYTDVKLPSDGAYTNKERALQGASPYLLNADITYSPSLGGDRQLNIALLYNLQGPRIHAVGISGLGDVIQKPVHTLNFVASCKFSRNSTLKFKLTDMLNQPMVFMQEVPQKGTSVEVERYRTGIGFEIGYSLNF